ncbi:MAG TPA: hypothetical protein VIQ31_02855 [Phormidium sp.]
MTEKTTVTITCKFTKLQFEATNKRTQVHPDIAWWKQQANKKGWYTRFFQAVEYGISKNFTTLTQFEEILEKASKDEPFEVIEKPVEPKTLKNFVAELTGEENRSQGSFLKKITSIDTSFDSGYSLIGDFLDLDSTTLILEDGLYLDCATSERSNNDIRKQRKAYSVYTLLKIEHGETASLLQFGGRRLNECPELKQLLEMLVSLGLKDVAKEKQAEAIQVNALKESTDRCVIKDDSVLGKVGEVINYEGKQYKILYIESEYWSEDEDGISCPGYRSVGDAGAVIVSSWMSNKHYLKSFAPGERENFLPIKYVPGEGFVVDEESQEQQQDETEYLFGSKKNAERLTCSLEEADTGDLESMTLDEAYQKLHLSDRTLERLIGELTPENSHEPIDEGKPIGNEFGSESVE